MESKTLPTIDVPGIGAVQADNFASEQTLNRLIDAVNNEETGLLFKSKSVNELAKAMVKLASDDELRIRYGKNARQRAQKDFSEKILTKALIDLYVKILNKNKKEFI